MENFKFCLVELSGVFFFFSFLYIDLPLVESADAEPAYRRLTILEYKLEQPLWKIGNIC